MTTQQFIQIITILTILGLNVATWLTVQKFKHTVKMLEESVQKFLTLTEKTLEKVNKIESNTENHSQMDAVQHSNIMAKVDVLNYKVDDLAKDMAHLKGIVK